jgi:hypothetical protein
MPRVTCLTPTVFVGRKLPYIRDLYNCLLAQTMTDWEWILMCDRFEDYDRLMRYQIDKRVKLVYDDLADVDRSQRHPIPTLYNRWYPQAKGEFLFPAFDDDLLHPDIMKVFCDFFDARPDNDACYISLQHQHVDKPGVSDEGRAHWLLADRLRMSGMLDCQIDGGQACIRKTLLDKVPAPWWPETAAWGELRHCDGLMLQNFSQATDFYPTGITDVAYLTHRFTPVSTFTNNRGVIHG